MSFNEIKQEGNDCIKQKNYAKAIELYTKALAADPASHAVYSNRSLAYSNIKDFESALKDATKCLDLAPTFARGFLRKVVALIGLKKYKEAMIAAQEGYKLRGSDTISRDCVAQWVKANQIIYKPLVEQKLFQSGMELLPRGCLVLSEEYLDIFLDMLIYRTKLTNEIEPVVKSLNQAFAELDHILNLFGHSACPYQQVWIKCTKEASKINPSTARVPLKTATALLTKSDEFATWLHMSVDPILHPVICPIVSLAMIAVTVRSIKLNAINCDQHVNQLCCQACLPFFEKSVLSSEKYAEQLLGIYKEFLEAWAMMPVAFTKEERLFVEHSIKKVEDYLKHCPDQHVHYKKAAMVSIALVKIRLGKEPGLDPVLYAPEHGKAVSRMVDESPHKLVAYVAERFENLEEAIHTPLNGPIPYVDQDAQDVLYCIGSLLKLGMKEIALQAFQLAESAYLRLLKEQINSKSFSFDESGMLFHTAQSHLLMNVAAFLGTENNLVADALIRWNCIYSEFRTILIRFGIGSRYLKTFHAIEQLNLSNHDHKADDNVIVALAEEHKVEINQVLAEVGPRVLLCLLRQNYELLQSVLEPGQFILEYHLDAREGESHDPQSHDGYLVLHRHKEDPIVQHIDPQLIFPASRKWAILLSRDIIDEEVSKEAAAVASELSKLLLPSDVCKVIGRLETNRLFICPDGVLGVLPLELLPLENGRLLSEECNIVHLSSARELLRELVIAAVAKVHDNILDNDKEDSTSQQCVLFANPNFDLEKPSPEGDTGFWASVVSGLTSIFSSPVPETAVVPMLPGSQQEADGITEVLSNSDTSIVSCTYLLDDATLSSVLEINSPFIIHFSTHGFSFPESRGVRSSFWDDTETGLLLAGANTYRTGKLTKIHPRAGTGTLTSLAACGMNLSSTRLVYLSTCVSSRGFYSYGEAVNSLAQAFRAAGAQTVIATLWPLSDDSAARFAYHFYQELCKPGVSPSHALAHAKKMMKMEMLYDHWFFWGSFICIGMDKPLFPITQ